MIYLSTWAILIGHLFKALNKPYFIIHGLSLFIDHDFWSVQGGAPVRERVQLVYKYYN